MDGSGETGSAGTEQAERGRQLELLVESVSDYAIFVLDPDGVIQTWNRGAERTKGYTPEDIIGQHFSIFYTDEDRERDHPAAELEIAAREGRYEEEGWRIRKDGSRFWANVVITALRDPEGRLTGFGKVTRDLTSRRLAEEQLRATATGLRTANDELEQFRRMVAGVRDYAIFMLDPGGHVATWNAGAEHINGYTTEEIIGRHFSTFYTDEDRERNHPATELEIAAREGRYEEEGWRIRKDGTAFWANVVITALRNEHGTLVGFSKVTRDLTQRREAEQQLAATQEQLRRSNEELDRFASVAAHDLREPLRTVAGFAGLLASRFGDRLPEGAAPFLDEIGASVERMQELIDSLLAYARAGEVAPGHDPVPIAGAAGHVLADLKAAVAERRAEVEVLLAEDATVTAHQGDVEMVLRNLLSNALKFSDAEQPRVTLAGDRVQDAWRIVVTDNGIGVAPEDVERIFSPFQRLHARAEYPGTGLGLAICKRVVERHGGAIGVDSTPGQGSRFWVTLPAAD
jgi:PAS domain S-box-containing protein